MTTPADPPARGIDPTGRLPRDIFELLGLYNLALAAREDALARGDFTRASLLRDAVHDFGTTIDRLRLRLRAALVEDAP